MTYKSTMDRAGPVETKGHTVPERVDRVYAQTDLVGFTKVVLKPWTVHRLTLSSLFAERSTLFRDTVSYAFLWFLQTSCLLFGNHERDV